MKDFWEEKQGKQEKKINKKKIIILIILVILLITCITIGIIYAKNEQFRNWIDINVLKKEINQENLPTIELKEDDNPTICAFSQNIGVLSKNEFKIYNSTGKEEKTLTLEITTPIIDTSNRYLAIGEDNGKKIYLIADKEIVWEKEITGNISQIAVNQNGYVAITIVNTSNKAVVEVYDEKGNELFKTFYATNRVADISLSNDNKYLAVAEIDTAGTIIKSNIQIISIEAASNNPDNSIVKKIEGQNNDLISNIKYQEKNKLICMYTDRIDSISEDGNIETLYKSEDKKVTFMDINMQNSIIAIEEKSSGLFTADSNVSIINTDNKSVINYTVDSVTKEIYTGNNIIGLNLGTEMEFINTNGWLVKRYIGSQEITKVVLSNSIAGIVYRDRIEIINL